MKIQQPFHDNINTGSIGMKQKYLAKCIKVWNYNEFLTLIMQMAVQQYEATLNTFEIPLSHYQSAIPIACAVYLLLMMTKMV